MTCDSKIDENQNYAPFQWLIVCKWRKTFEKNRTEKSINAISQNKPSELLLKNWRFVSSLLAIPILNVNYYFFLCEKLVNYPLLYIRMKEKKEGKLNGCTVGCRSKLDVALLMAMKCYVLRVLLLREHSANVHAMVSSELTFYPTSLSTTCGRTVIDMVVAEKDVAEFQFHRYCIHPWGMVCHRLNAVNHIDLACACIH